jgi:lipopolysaccharide transport system ATP-binding protein
MTNIAIKVENLGKKYLIRHQQKESYQTFQDLILKGSSNIIQSLNPFNKSSQKKSESIEEFWALATSDGVF